ncbi:MULTISPECIES: hypothetical protein [unclassified Ruminococcus]|uniref:hypothetical protein n=1 Tax=unclassified Ruminococcus TaxID=2608920 RepID=UPI000930A6A6|nr:MULTISPECIES: hypothetical protein [unclassified Ruminococcus]
MPVRSGDYLYQEHFVGGSHFAELLVYYGSEAEITVPSEIDDLPVRVLGPCLYNDNETATKIIVPDSV